MTNLGQSNLTGGLWLLCDMALNVWALSMVKALGLGYPAAQLVFLRACVGLLVILPFLWPRRAEFVNLPQKQLHLLRIVLSAAALTASYYAIARVPFALFTAIGFTRPMVLMALAALLLRETVPGKRWIAAAVAFGGVLIAVQPDRLEAGGWGISAVFVTVFLGTAAIIVTRKLHASPVVVMMGVYGLGLALLSAPFAAFTWVVIPDDELLPLLAIGLFAQTGQFCFLCAHKRAEAGFLAILGYLSLILSTGVGYFLFDEVPTIRFAIGASLIVLAALWVTMSGTAKRRFAVR